MFLVLIFLTAEDLISDDDFLFFLRLLDISIWQQYCSVP